MIVSVDIDDASWLAVKDLERRTAEIANLCERQANFGAVPVEVAFLFTDDQTVAQLNAQWRAKQGPTNVLSFPGAASTPLATGQPRQLGDVALAFGVVSREALEQGKTLEAHASHLIVHGLLHLAGFDHMNERDAQAMEMLETRILAEMGIADPYRIAEALS
jgi:probable rRNA maturation factor